jgi:hypothetical protein
LLKNTEKNQKRAKGLLERPEFIITHARLSKSHGIEFRTLVGTFEAQAEIWFRKGKNLKSV